MDLYFVWSNWRLMGSSGSLSLMESMGRSDLYGVGGELMDVDSNSASWIKFSANTS